MLRSSELWNTNTHTELSPWSRNHSICIYMFHSAPFSALLCSTEPGALRAEQPSLYVPLSDLRITKRLVSSVLPSSPLIGWLQEQQRAIMKLSWAVCCSAPTVCQQCGGECWRGTASSRRQCLFVGMLVCVMTGINNQPHPVLPRTHHPLPPEKHYVGHSATR